MNNNKRISASNLIDILAKLPGHYSLVPNSLGNLVVVGANNEYLGYVCFNYGKLELDSPE